jgi:hypothetical protein
VLIGHGHATTVLLPRGHVSGRQVVEMCQAHLDHLTGFRPYDAAMPKIRPTNIAAPAANYAHTVHG